MLELIKNVDFWKAISSFAWPITAIILALLFRRFLEGLLKRDQMTLKVAGMEITVAQAAKQAGAGLSDLQERVAALEVRYQDKAQIEPVTLRSSSHKGAILWVDDFPSNNAFIIEKLESDGVRVRKELSTDAAMKALSSDEFHLVISDLGRIENGNDNPFAGLEFSRAVRVSGNSVPILIFAGQRGLDNRQKLLSAGATDVTSSPVDVFRFIEAHLPKVL